MRGAISPLPNTPSWLGAQLQAGGLGCEQLFNGRKCVANNPPKIQTRVFNTE